MPQATTARSQHTLLRPRGRFTQRGRSCSVELHTNHAADTAICTQLTLIGCISRISTSTDSQLSAGLAITTNDLAGE
jgi:hypothetical protein